MNVIFLTSFSDSALSLALMISLTLAKGLFFPSPSDFAPILSPLLTIYQTS